MIAAIGRFESDMSALATSVERAGVALGCRYSSADEFEAECVRDYWKRRTFARHALQARLVLGATAVTSLAMLLVLTF